MADQWGQILEDFQELTPKERIDTFTKLLEYSLPKLNRTELDNVNGFDSLFSMTAEQRQERIKELTQKLKKV